MHLFRVTSDSGRKILINPKDIRWVEEESGGAVIEFLNGERIHVKCYNFDDLEQKILDASLPEIDLKSTDGITLYVSKDK